MAISISGLGPDRLTIDFYGERYFLIRITPTGWQLFDREMKLAFPEKLKKGVVAHRDWDWITALGEALPLIQQKARGNNITGVTAPKDPSGV